MDDAPGAAAMAWEADRRTAWGMLGLLALMLPMLGFLVAIGRPFVAALLAIVLPMGARVAVPVLRHRGPRLFIDERGVEDLIWPFGLIEWEDIHSVHMHECAGDLALCIIPRDRARLTRGRPWPLRWTDAAAAWLVGGRSPAHIRMRLLRATEDELFDFLDASGLLDRTEIGAAAHFDTDLWPVER